MNICIERVQKFSINYTNESNKTKKFVEIFFTTYIIVKCVVKCVCVAYRQGGNIKDIILKLVTHAGSAIMYTKKKYHEKYFGDRLTLKKCLTLQKSYISSRRRRRIDTHTLSFN